MVRAGPDGQHGKRGAMIKISVIYIGIVVILSAFIAGVPFVLWSDDTAEQVEKVANIPLGQIIRPVSGGAAAQTAGGGAAPASSSGSPTPTPMPAITPPTMAWYEASSTICCGSHP